MSKNWTLPCFPFTSLSLLLVSFAIFLTIEADNDGFTVDLMHRDSPQSPFYNPSLTHFHRAKNAFRRSLERANHFASASLVPNGGEYLMKISYGTPPFETLAIVDTGSDITWLQCLPCTHCYKEKYQPFNPKNSSTFRFVPCTSEICHDFLATNDSTCDSRSSHKICDYKVSYGDLSYSRGDLATETIIFGSRHKKLSFQNFVFGCGHNNNGTFSDKVTGLVGLGLGKFSLISQLNSSIRGKFSYCLGPFTQVSKPGKISFGNHAVVSGHGVVSTPLILEPPFYKTILEGISVANKTLQFHNPSKMSQEGNIIIDSGTTITYLPVDFYNKLRSTIRDEIKSNKIVLDPVKFFDLCYSSLDDADVPPVTLHFKGADLKLKPLNIFLSTSESSVCLAFRPSAGLPLFGNVAQMNIKVGYDLEKRMISFKPTDCSRK